MEMKHARLKCSRALKHTRSLFSLCCCLLSLSLALAVDLAVALVNGTVSLWLALSETPDKHLAS